MSPDARCFTTGRDLGFVGHCLGTTRRDRESSQVVTSGELCEGFFRGCWDTLLVFVLGIGSLPFKRGVSFFSKVFTIIIFLHVFTFQAFCDADTHTQMWDDLVVHIDADLELYMDKTWTNKCDLLYHASHLQDGGDEDGSFQ